MSMNENLAFIKDNGIKKFICNEKDRWMKDGRIFCVHNQKYYDMTRE